MVPRFLQLSLTFLAISDFFLSFAHFRALFNAFNAFCTILSQLPHSQTNQLTRRPHTPKSTAQTIPSPFCNARVTHSFR